MIAGSLWSDEIASNVALLGIRKRPSPTKFVVAARPTAGDAIIFYSVTRERINLNYVDLATRSTYNFMFEPLRGQWLTRIARLSVARRLPRSAAASTSDSGLTSTARCESHARAALR